MRVGASWTECLGEGLKQRSIYVHQAEMYQ